MTNNNNSPEDKCIKETNFNFPEQTSFYRGKVRDVYRIKDRLIMVASDRISAFDHVLPRPIPYKGAILNGIAAHFLDSVSDLVPHWLEACPDPNVSIGKNCEPIKVEMVIRGYLAGHAWREYKKGKRELCGASMKDGMKESDKFLTPIITPSTKASEGHDEYISPTEIIERGIVSESVYKRLKNYTLALYRRGTEMAAGQGLILVDTKYEFGLSDGEVYLIDEVHTPDSSRYYIKEGYEERQKNDVPQEQLSKEFVREWLMENGFQGKVGQEIPEMSDEFVWKVSERYERLYETLTGKKVPKSQFDENPTERVFNNISEWLQSN